MLVRAGHCEAIEEVVAVIPSPTGRARRCLQYGLKALVRGFS